MRDPAANPKQASATHPGPFSAPSGEGLRAGGPRPTIAISAGDPQGIGPEITVKALADAALRGRAAWRVHGVASVLAAAAEQAGAGEALGDPAVTIVEPAEGGGDASRASGPPTAWGGRVAHACVLGAIGDAQREPGEPGFADAIVTAPISKEAWRLAGVMYPGHTELLAERFASPRSAMLFVGPRLNVILVTIHVPLARVPGLITPERVFDAIDLGAAACRGLGYARPRVAVAGLNPHAGEHGLFGAEDERAIAPAIARAVEAGIDASGPHPGDAVFLHAADGRYDLVVAMYHDQGLIPVKLLDRAASVNVTVGLAWRGRGIVRTSPAHGTAFDIAGTNAVDATSMRCAIERALAMVEGGARREA